LDINTIKQILESKNIKPIYLLHGEESYYIDLYSKMFESGILNEGEQSFNQATFYGKDTKIQQIIDEAIQYPMMASHRVVIIKEAQDLRSIGDLVKYTDNHNPNTVLIINYKTKKIDKRLKLYKSIQKVGEIFESKKLYDNELPKWISQYCTSKGFQIDNQAAIKASEFLGNDLSKIANEFDKLFLNHDVSLKISSEEIHELIGVSKDYNVFELQKTLGQRDFVKSNAIINYMGNNSKSNPLPMVLGSLYNYFSKVFIAAAYSNKPDIELQRALGLSSSYFLRDYKSAANNFPYNKMKTVMSALKNADLQSKGVGQKGMDESDILKELLIKVFS
jgi:DNA polymerase-3 subunit delta